MDIFDGKRKHVGQKNMYCPIIQEKRRNKLTLYVHLRQQEMRRVKSTLFKLLFNFGLS